MPRSRDAFTQVGPNTMMMRAGRLFLALGVLPALAVLAAMQSLSTVAIARVPESATMVPAIDRNAFTATAIAALSGTDGAGSPPNPSAIGLAGRTTFRTEPTNADAVSLMALSRQIVNDTDGARRLYREALRIDPRNEMANLWLIEDASMRGRVGTILDLYDAVLRTGGTASAALFDTLATALREPAILPYIETRLARRPAWAEQFWLRTAPNPSAIANLGLVRKRLFDRGITNPAGNDGDIVSRLVAAGRYDIAVGLAHRMAGSPPPGTTTVRNASFDKASRMPPFDWETFAESGYGAEIDPATGVLAFFAQDAVDAMVAHQLIETRPGRFVLGYRVRTPGSLAPMRASLRLRCVDPLAAPLGALAISAASGRTGFTIPAQCRYAWLEVWARRAEGSGIFFDDALLDAVTIERSGR